MIKTSVEYVDPIKGAARYEVASTLSGWVIVMYPADGAEGSVIDSGMKRYDTANRRCARWQKKENAAVLKSNSK